MKIAGFAQLHEELRRGFLGWWMQSMERVCDVIYIWDQNSKDGSKEFYKQHPKCVVVEHHCNDFLVELKCKSKLLEKLHSEQPDTDWIFWMDGDTVLEERAHDEIRGYLAKSDADNVHLSHLNLWRGTSHYRVDSQFDSMIGGLPAFWRSNNTCVLKSDPGLHGGGFPRQGRSNAKSPYSLLHLGFWSDEVLYERMVTGDLPRRDPNMCHHHRHYRKPILVELSDGMLPPYIPRRQSRTDPLPPHPQQRSYA